MTQYDVRIFEVAKGSKEPAQELAPMTVRAGSIDKARAALREKLEKAGHKVRGISFGPNDAGVDALVAYVWVKE